MATASQHSIRHTASGFGGGVTSGLGLLTTVASLPPKYRSRYLNIKTKAESPLDLSLKSHSPSIASDVPLAASFAEVYTEPSQPPSPPTEAGVTAILRTSNRIHPQQQQLRTNVVICATQSVAAATSPPSPPSKRTHLAADLDDVELEPDESESCPEINGNPSKVPKAEVTPQKLVRSPATAPKTSKGHAHCPKLSRNKATRRLKFDEETSSPVSGTIIRPLEEITDNAAQYSNGDIDPRYNIVEATEETKAELAAIRNVIGDYVCKLCRLKFDDAFGLARHRCACIVLLEYRCPECGKQFNCPANLASHRRWHKPKKDGGAAVGQKKENRASAAAKTAKTAAAANKKKSADEAVYFCSECGRKFKRHAYLRKHQATCVKGRKTPAETGPRIGSAAASANTDSPYNSCHASSSCVSSRSSFGTQEDEGVYLVAHGYGFDGDTASEYSAASPGFGRLQIVEGGLTEEENIAATALTNLRNCASVIQHTTLAH